MQRNVDIIVAAKDEASGTLQKVADSEKAFARTQTAASQTLATAQKAARREGLSAPDLAQDKLAEAHAEKLATFAKLEKRILEQGAGDAAKAQEAVAAVHQAALVETETFERKKLAIQNEAAAAQKAAAEKAALDVIRIRKEEEEAKKSGGLFGSAKALNKEARQSGDTAFEKILKGGGAIALISFALEGLAKAAEGAREGMQGLAGGTMTASEAVGHTIEKSIDAVPVLGNFVKAVTGIENAAEDMAGSLAESLGASKEWAEKNVTSAETVKAKYEQVSKTIDAMLATSRKLRNEATVSGLKGSQKDDEEETQRHNAKIAEITKQGTEEQAKLRALGLDSSSKESRQAMRVMHAALEDEQKIHGDKSANIQREAALKAEDEELRHQGVMGGLASHAETERLSSLGASLGAELVKLQAENAKAEVEAKRHLEEMNKNATPEEQKKNTENAIQEKYARGVASAGEARDLIKANAEAERKIEEQAGDQLKDTQARISAERLRAMGLDFDARRVEINRQLEKENADIQRKLEEQYSPEKLAAAKAAFAQAAAAHPEGAGDINRAGDAFAAQAAAAKKAAADQQAANKALADSERDKVRKDESDAAANEKEQNRARAVAIRIDLLKEEGSLGNKIAEEQAKQLELEERVRAKREEINKLLREGHNLTNQDKAALLAQLAVTDKLAKLESDKLKKADGLRQANPGLPNYEDASGGGDTGVASAYQGRQAVDDANKQDQMAKDIADIAEQIKKQTEAILKFFDDVSQLPDWMQDLVNASTTDVLAVN